MGESARWAHLTIPVRLVVKASSMMREKYNGGELSKIESVYCFSLLFFSLLLHKIVYNIILNPKILLYANI